MQTKQLCFTIPYLLTYFHVTSGKVNELSVFALVKNYF